MPENRKRWRRCRRGTLYYYAIGVLLCILLVTGCVKRGENLMPPSAEEIESSLPVPEISETPVEMLPTVEPFPTEETGGEQPTWEDGYNWEKTAIIATDLHYLARSLTDRGSGFQYMVEHGDGKVVTYIEQIVDAFLEEVIAARPDILILSGDLSLDGEIQSHRELADKLYRVKDAGIPVVVIPGNHDINNHHAAEYKGDVRLPASFTTAQEFEEIYADFGYKEAISRDQGSLSYVYQVDEYNRLLMLDTCQYRQKAQVGGAILSDTYDWIDIQLELAWEEGMNMIPVAHHNLLDQSEIYVEDCTIEHGEQLVDRLEEWDVPLFLSGHLHVQHNKRSEEDWGIWEVVTGSLATPKCQYGVLRFRDDGSFAYHTQAVDVESWAKREKRTEKDLLEFNAFQEPFLRRVFYNQSHDALTKLTQIPEPQKEIMSRLYSNLNYHYYQGTAVEIKEAVRENPNYHLWIEEGASTVLSDYVQYILEDAKRDYNQLE